MAQRPEGGAVIYSVSVPDVRDLLAAARHIIRGVLTDQDSLKSELGTGPAVTVGAEGPRR